MAVTAAARAAVDLVRAYDPRARRATGTRVLVDRVWPRGIRKDDLNPDIWMREIAPSDELRHWFGHRPERWPEFQKRYRRQLTGKARQPLLEDLEALTHKGRLTLVYGARDEERNQAVVLRQVLLERVKSQGGSK